MLKRALIQLGPEEASFSKGRTFEQKIKLVDAPDHFEPDAFGQFTANPNVGTVGTPLSYWTTNPKTPELNGALILFQSPPL